MTHTTEQAAAIVLDWLQRADATLTEQAPLLAEEIVLRGAIIYGAWTVVLAFLVAVCCLLACWLIRRARKHDDGNAGAAGLMFICVSIVFLLSFVGVAGQLITVLASPRLYVINELGKIIP
jgi:cytochrome bd-type quinol oxidase subunit 2